MSQTDISRLGNVDRPYNVNITTSQQSLAALRSLSLRAPSLPTISDAACRTLDLILAVTLLVLVAGLLVIIALAIWLQDRGPLFFTHQRIGKNGRSFQCLKFRTMVTNADARLKALLASDPVARAEWESTHKLRHDCRVTPLGAFLRRSSLDELPQLLNVIRGEMSLVGPRPIILEETVKYGPFLRHYYSVRPGITGLWQVKGRSNVGYRQRVVMDVTYVKRRCFALNCWIILSTIPVVLGQRGAC